jgi:hypothetical protein
MPGERRGGLLQAILFMSSRPKEWFQFRLYEAAKLISLAMCPTGFRGAPPQLFP